MTTLTASRCCRAASRSEVSRSASPVPRRTRRAPRDTSSGNAWSRDVDAFLTRQPADQAEQRRGRSRRQPEPCLQRLLVLSLVLRPAARIVGRHRRIGLGIQTSVSMPFRIPVKSPRRPASRPSRPMPNSGSMSTAAGICTGAAAQKCTTGSVVACPCSPWEGPARGATRPRRGWRRPARGRGLWAHGDKRGVIRTVAGVVTGSA